MALTFEETKTVLTRAREAGLLYGASGEELLERAKVWAAALEPEGVTLDEATSAVVWWSRQTGEDRIISLRPGHVLEVVLEHRRKGMESKAKRLAAGECPNENCQLGWDYFTDERGYAKVRRCGQCRAMAATA